MTDCIQVLRPDTRNTEGGQNNAEPVPESMNEPARRQKERKESKVAAREKRMIGFNDDSCKEPTTNLRA